MNNNKKHQYVKAAAILACLLMMLGLAACTVSTTFTIDDISFDLTNEWSFNTDKYTFTKEGNATRYFFIDDSDQAGDCTTAEERAAMYSTSDGIEISTITVAGDDGVLVVEPGEETQKCSLFFYEGGKEYLISYEIDAGSDPVDDTTQELIDSIQ